MNMKKLWAYNIGLYEKQYNDHSRDKILMKKIKLTKKQKRELDDIAKYFLEATEPIDDPDLKAMVTAKILSRIGALSDRLVSKNNIDRIKRQYKSKFCEIRY